MGKTVSVKFPNCYSLYMRYRVDTYHLVTRLLLSEQNVVLNICGGVWAPVRDGRADLTLLFQGEIQRLM